MPQIRQPLRRPHVEVNALPVRNVLVQGRADGAGHRDAPADAVDQRPDAIARVAIVERRAYQVHQQLDVAPRQLQALGGRQAGALLVVQVQAADIHYNRRRLAVATQNRLRIQRFPTQLIIHV